MKNKITTDNALLFSAIFLLIFTISIEVMFYIIGNVPDVLIASVFATFGVAEGGYCAFIHKIRKTTNMKKRLGDITGFDDAEVIDDEPDDGELVSDLDGDYCVCDSVGDDLHIDSFK